MKHNQSHFYGFGPAVEAFMFENDNIALVVLDEAGTIITSNKCFNAFLSRGQDLCGRPIYALLDDEYGVDVLKSKSSPKVPVWLRFKRNGNAPVSLRCCIHIDEAGRCLILGTFKTETDDTVLKKMTALSNELTNITRQLRRKNRELEEANAKIKTLRGIIPICMHCKKVRDDEGYWNRLERYISDNSEALFSHGICDDCMKKLYPDVDMDDDALD